MTIFNTMDLDLENLRKTLLLQYDLLRSVVVVTPGLECTIHIHNETALEDDCVSIQASSSYSISSA